MHRNLALFLTFAQVGVCTFGGGYAMLPILQREVVDKRHWATEEELMDYYAIGQCTPGVIAVNTATFIGFRQGGVWGAVCATAGMVFPSLVIISVIAAFLQQFAHLPVVRHAFAGIRVAVCALVLHAVWNLAKKGATDVLTIGLLLATFLSVALLGLSPLVIVPAAGGIGIFAGWLRRKNG